MSNRLVAIILIILVSFVMFKSFSMTGNQGYEEITAKEAKKMIEQEEQVVIIDVRQPYEFENGHISGAELIPLNKIKTTYNQLDPNKKFIMVCTSGVRSAEASKFLVEQGFTEVYNLGGGMLAWNKL